MESENLLTPTEGMWRAVEKINDVLSQTADLQQALQIGLDILLSALERDGGALYLPRFCEHVTQDWTVCGAPPAWQSGPNGHHPNPGSGLRGVIDQVMTSGQIAPGQPELEFGAVFPVRSARQSFGALLVWGPTIPEAEYSRWLTLLKPFARVVTLHAQLSGNTQGIPSYIELMRSRNTLRAMFDSLPISIYIIDPAYNLVAINNSRAARVNDRPPNLVGRKCYEKLYHRTSPCTGCRVGETFATGQSTLRLSRDWLDQDKFVEWEISTFPILDETSDRRAGKTDSGGAITGGAITGESETVDGKGFVFQTILIEQDVTEKRNLEANLIQSEKLAAVGQLAAGVAHEINNPLTAIIANAQILRHDLTAADANTADLMDSIKLIEMAGTRASQVVRNLLGIARKEKYDFEPIDLNETLNNAISLVQHELIGRPIQVQLSLAEHLPRVLASQDQLQGVWINLILNAIDAIDKDNGQIAVASRFTGSEFQVTIMDNGKGIATDHLPRVFEPFFTTKSPGRGTGLGLSVCMRVVRHHGGDLRVESQVGKWTKFTVILPGPKQ